MRIEEYQRLRQLLRFVQSHAEWKVKLDKFLNAPEMERSGSPLLMKWLKRDVETFIEWFADDIDLSMSCSFLEALKGNKNELP